MSVMNISAQQLVPRTLKIQQLKKQILIRKWVKDVNRHFTEDINGK